MSSLDRNKIAWLNKEIHVKIKIHQCHFHRALKQNFESLLEGQFYLKMKRSVNTQYMKKPMR